MFTFTIQTLQRTVDLEIDPRSSLKNFSNFSLLSPYSFPFPFEAEFGGGVSDTVVTSGIPFGISGPEYPTSQLDYSAFLGMTTGQSAVISAV